MLSSKFRRFWSSPAPSDEPQSVTPARHPEGHRSTSSSDRSATESSSAETSDERPKESSSDEVKHQPPLVSSDQESSFGTNPLRRLSSAFSLDAFRRSTSSEAIKASTKPTAPALDAAALAKVRERLEKEREELLGVFNQLRDSSLTIERLGGSAPRPTWREIQSLSQLVMSNDTTSVRCDDLGLTLRHIELKAGYNNAVSVVACLERCLSPSKTSPMGNWLDKRAKKKACKAEIKAARASRRQDRDRYTSVYRSSLDSTPPDQSQTSDGTRFTSPSPSPPPRLRILGYGEDVNASPVAMSPVNGSSTAGATSTAAAPGGPSFLSLLVRFRPISIILMETEIDQRTVSSWEFTLAMIVGSIRLHLAGEGITLKPFGWRTGKQLCRRWWKGVALAFGKVADWAWATWLSGSSVELSKLAALAVLILCALPALLPVFPALYVLKTITEGKIPARDLAVHASALVILLVAMGYLAGRELEWLVVAAVMDLVGVALGWYRDWGA